MPRDPGPQGPAQVDRLSGAVIIVSWAARRPSPGGLSVTEPYGSAGLSRERTPAPITHSGARGRGGGLRPTALSTCCGKGRSGLRCRLLRADDHAAQAPRAHLAATGLLPAPPGAPCLCSLLVLPL